MHNCLPFVMLIFLSIIVWTICLYFTGVSLVLGQSCGIRQSSRIRLNLIWNHKKTLEIRSVCIIPSIYCDHINWVKSQDLTVMAHQISDLLSICSTVHWGPLQSNIKHIKTENSYRGWRQHSLSSSAWLANLVLCNIRMADDMRNKP